MATKPRRFSSRFGPDFGLGRYCVATVNEDDELPDGTIGMVRLWSPTEKSGVFVRVSISDRGNTTIADETDIGDELLARMTDSLVDFANFDGNHTFYCDVRVSDELIARYA